MTQDNLQIIEDTLQDILDDEEISDSALMQYCIDAIELISPNIYTEDQKHSIIWNVFQSRNQS